MIVFGELGNLTVYGDVPEAIVTSFGSVGVVTNVFITTFLLKEPLTKQILFDTDCVILDIVVVVVYAFLTVVFIILYPVSLRYGKKYVLIPVGIYTVIIVVSLNVVTTKIFSTEPL